MKERKSEELERSILRRKKERKKERKTSIQNEREEIKENYLRIKSEKKQLNVCVNLRKKAEGLKNKKNS